MLSRYEKRAQLEFLKDMRRSFESGLITPEGNPIIRVMNSLLVDSTGATHWRYGTPTMFALCGRMYEVITGERQDSDFYMSNMPKYDQRLTLFSRDHAGLARHFLDLIDKTADAIKQEDIAA